MRRYRTAQSQTALRIKSRKAQLLFCSGFTEKTFPAAKLCFAEDLASSFPTVVDNIHTWQSDPKNNQLIEHNQYNGMAAESDTSH